MYIVYGSSLTPDMQSRYVVLELDTFRYIKQQRRVDVAYCLLNTDPLQLPQELADDIQLHQQLMEHYRAREWDQCNDTIEQLMGKWAGEVDSFYQLLRNRVEYLSETTLPDNWDGIIEVHR